MIIEWSFGFIIFQSDFMQTFQIVKLIENYNFNAAIITFVYLIFQKKPHFVINYLCWLKAWILIMFDAKNIFNFNFLVFFIYVLTVLNFHLIFPNHYNLEPT